MPDAEAHLAKMRYWLAVAEEYERRGWHDAAAYFGEAAADELERAQAFNMEDDHEIHR